MRLRLWSALFTSMLLSTLAAMAAQDDHPSVVAQRTDKAPTINGVFDDNEWKGSAIIDNFTQVYPTEGVAPTEKTVVHFFYDSDNLYFGIQCFDSDPTSILAKQMQREGDVSSDDVVNIVLGSFADKRNGYIFSVTAAGGKIDGLVDAQNGTNTQWDGLWVGKSQITTDGWTAEFAIPLRAISFSTNSTDWELNISRQIRRKQESVRWSAPFKNFGIEALQQAGTLSGLENLRQGIGLTIEPFGSIAANLNNGTVLFRPGFTMAYKLTPSTTAQLTVNTDFAEAEVDQQVVNLSRFPVFFPEKRAFFLQDASIFSFGGIQESPLPFYSRRIGIVRGAKKDIFAGLKVTGREGILNFGVLDVQMYDDPDLGPKNLAAARVTANLLEESTAGIILTHGDPATTGSNTLIGSDFNYTNSHVFDNQVLQARGWVMGSFSTQGPPNLVVPSGTNQDDIAFGTGISYPNDKLYVSLFAGRYGRDFRPTLGFIQRPGTWELNANTYYRWRPTGFIQRIDLAPKLYTFLNLDGSLQSLTGVLPEIQIEDADGDVLYLAHLLKREVLDQPFPISSNVTISPGRYGFNIFSADLATSPKRVLSVNSGITYGSFYSGKGLETYLELKLRPSRHFLFGAYYQYIHYALAEGDVIVHIGRANANVIFSPTISWNTLAQYDTVSKSANLSSVFRYEISPGQNAFIVVNQGIGISDGFVLTALAGQVSLKLGMTLLF